MCSRLTGEPSRRVTGRELQEVGEPLGCVRAGLTPWNAGEERARHRHETVCVGCWGSLGKSLLLGRNGLSLEPCHAHHQPGAAWGQSSLGPTPRLIPRNGSCRLLGNAAPTVGSLEGNSRWHSRGHHTGLSHLPHLPIPDTWVEEEMLESCFKVIVREPFFLSFHFDRPSQSVSYTWWSPLTHSIKQGL